MCCVCWGGSWLRLAGPCGSRARLLGLVGGGVWSPLVVGRASGLGGPRLSGVARAGAAVVWGSWGGRWGLVGRGPLGRACPGEGGCRACRPVGGGWWGSWGGLPPVGGGGKPATNCATLMDVGGLLVDFTDVCSIAGDAVHSCLMAYFVCPDGGLRCA